ncbi:hypothetical protein JRG18_12585 [Kocuria palustris]|uniref:hypothetical protein n=1 Tax=Kocuria palustris TaxID=71999 RepID=UPI0019D25B42|nr:hypothetical protein [Kocuria palustris]MBN6754335.1 hypothetical protein [Kocuria palustris]MBN6759290.1 hypothetical protein [Kocuria palustris]MBN6764316.1 hypothetical protein [Kocuria palustris]MBN6783801.1 hypothetical protein [Kocuria palustris]MBN6800283.1 hypothetical protein [Kocuria palustris]
MFTSAATPDARSTRRVPAAALAVLIIAAAAGLVSLPFFAPLVGLVLAGPLAVVLVILLVRELILDFREIGANELPAFLVPAAAVAVLVAVSCWAVLATA